jgi:hypothetical protein
MDEVRFEAWLERYGRAWEERAACYGNGGMRRVLELGALNSSCLSGGEVGRQSSHSVSFAEVLALAPSGQVMLLLRRCSALPQGRTRRSDE